MSHVIPKLQRPKLSVVAKAQVRSGCAAGNPPGLSHMPEKTKIMEIKPHVPSCNVKAGWCNGRLPRRARQYSRP